MRLFVALALPGWAADELDQELAPLRPAWPGLRWTGTDAWHLTLAFLGEVEEPALAGLTTRLARAAGRHPRLNLSLGGAGAFPSQAKARVLWAGVQGDRQGLTALAASVAAGARRAGAPPVSDGRRYQPHLTLARCRSPVDVRPLVAALDSHTGGPWAAAEVYLIRSRLQQQPRYETLGAWPLRVPTPPGRAAGEASWAPASQAPAPANPAAAPGLGYGP
ncbi:MAG TPA: RNA 2',3'-cyclic phosphodiesterase [Streptosporangiaceae bacterium]|nr:RNA 2',3'-cyclic phosphodiesterase [Streptosporangiaceae bacterium]